MAARRIDIFRREGPLLVAPGVQNLELVSARMPTDSDGELAALGTEVSPASGADFIRFTPYIEQTPLPDYYDTHAQPGTVPIPYLARTEIGRGRLFRILVSNDSPTNAYSVNARAVVELQG